MNLLFDKKTSKLVAFSANDLSDQVGDSYTLHEIDVEINAEDIGGYTVSNGSVEYVETDEHRAMIADRNAIPSRAELFDQINTLQSRIDQLEGNK